MRDTIQWWPHRHRSLKDYHSKHLYLVFSTIPKDVAIPLQQLGNGELHLLGTSFDYVLNGPQEEIVSPDKIVLMEMRLLRQYLIECIST